MAYKTLNKILILIILSFLVNKVINGHQFTPKPRAGYTATILGGKIYYIGGANFDSQVDISASDFLYLSLENSSWVDLKSQGVWVDLKRQGVKFPHTIRHTCKIGGANQDSIFIIGGRQIITSGLVYRTGKLVYRFDTNTNAIAPQIIEGKEPLRREAMSSVSYGGKIYIFSGITQDIPTWSNDFDILDTVNMTWDVGNLVKAPLPRIYYTATLVNSVIYYIGGVQQNGTNETYVPMADIYQYDTIGDTWSLKIATAENMPEVRRGHSAVLVNGKICIYGGSFDLVDPLRIDGLIPSKDQITMLDTITLEWSVPLLEDPNVPNLTFHTATLIGNLMIIAFGNIESPGEKTYNDKFYLFDFGEPKVKWYTSPNTDTDTNDPIPKDPPQSPLVIALCAIGGIIGICLLSTVIFFSYKYYKKREYEQRLFRHHAIDHF